MLNYPLILLILFAYGNKYFSGNLSSTPSIGTVSSLHSQFTFIKVPYTHELPQHSFKYTSTLSMQHRGQIWPLYRNCTVIDAKMLRVAPLKEQHIWIWQVHGQGQCTCVTISSIQPCPVTHLVAEVAEAESSAFVLWQWQFNCATFSALHSSHFD